MHTARIEARIDWCTVIPAMNFTAKDKQSVTKHIEALKLELRNRRDVTYRQLVATLLAGKGGDLQILLLADRLDEIGYATGDEENLAKAKQIREWIDKKNNTKVYT